LENYNKDILELIKKSGLNPKKLYTKNGYVINNRTPFKVKQPFYFFVVIMTTIANLFSKK